MLREGSQLRKKLRWPCVELVRHSAGYSIAGEQNEDDVDDLHGGAERDTGHVEAVDCLSGGVNVGGKDGDHHDGDPERGAAAHGGHEKTDGTSDLEDSGEEHEKAGRGECRRDDTG